MSNPSHSTSPSPGPGEIQCRRRVNNGHDRCPWRGTRDEFPAHTAETGHEACAVCRQSLADGEIRACSRCVTRVAADLADIIDAYAELPSVVEASGYHSGTLPGGTALVLLAGGSVQGGGPDDHPQFHDPIPVLPELHSWERDWRETFGHDHFPAWQATMATIVGHRHGRQLVHGYLLTWLWLAARTHDAFADFANEIRGVRWRVLHVAGLANDPDVAEAECFDCGGDLQRAYGDAGLEEDWTCSRCGRVYTDAAYYLALRAVLQLDQWRSIREAAWAIGERPQTVRNWADRLQVVSACRVHEKVTVVWWPDVLEHSEINQQEAS